MFAKAKGILEKSSSIRDEVSHGNYEGAKDIVTKGQSTKESTGQGGKANEVLDKGSSARDEVSKQGDKANDILDKGSSARDEVSKGNFNGAKEPGTQGQPAKGSTGQGVGEGVAGGAVGGVVGGASSSVAGMNKEDLNKENVQETGKKISRGIGQDNTGNPSTSDTKVEQREVGSEKPEAGQKQYEAGQKQYGAGQKQHDSTKANQDTGSKQYDRRGSVLAGDLEPNYDIRKGPITMPGTFQEKNYHNSTGRETLVQRGTSSKGISSQGTDNAPQVAFTGVGSDNTASSNQGNAGKAVAGGDYGEEALEKEPHDYDNISPDTFDDGATGKGFSKKSADEDVGKYHIDKKQLDQQGSQPSQKAGTGEAAAAAAAAAGATAGSGTSKGATDQTSTTRKRSKAHSVSGNNAAKAHDLTFTRSNDHVAPTAGERGYGSGQGLAASNQTNRGGVTYARVVSDRGVTPKTPTSTGYSTTGGSNQTSGLRSTTTGQTNSALFNNSATGSNQSGIAGGGVLGLHQDSSYGLSGNDNSGVNQGIAGGAGTRQAGAYGTSSTGGFNNETTQASSGTKTSAGNEVTSKRIVRQLSGSGYKVTVLQEKVQAVSQKCKAQLGLSASQISKRSPNVDAFFDAVAAERLRWMPHDGSRLDCSLRWASRLAYAVDALRESVGVFAPAADEAATLIWGFSILLLEVSQGGLWKFLDMNTNYLYSLIWTTRMSSRASLADMAGSPSVSTCFCSMRSRTNPLLNFSHMLPLSSQICLRWSAARP